MDDFAEIMKLLIVGMDARGHIGRFFLEAAQELGIDARISNVAQAMDGNPWVRRLQWRLAKRPQRLGVFSKQVVSDSLIWKPDIMLSTGICPLNVESLRRLHCAGIALMNYSTDDPWNPSHRSSWFLKGLPIYDHIFTTRVANLEDFERAGCSSVSWLPFAYQPEIHYREQSSGGGWESDVAFVGGADRDRVPVLGRLIDQGYRVSLWGGYWERFAATKGAARGMADLATMRKVIAGTRCALTLVRRANRDGHAMRTYEVAAMGSPALAEDTTEHREILGPESETSMYFSNDDELIEKCCWLVANPEDAAAMGVRLAKRIHSGANTYADRLKCILETVEVAKKRI